MTTDGRPIQVGTRGSSLALRQTDEVLDLLRSRHPGRQFEAHIHRVVTEGDRTQAANVPLANIAGRGIFVKDLETVLLTGEIDMAVHSLKDVPGELEPGLMLVAVAQREDARDVLVSRGGVRFHDLPKGARIGTGSTRRAALVLAARPDLVIVPIRGNVETRIRKVQDGEVDAAVLAAAGIARLGREGDITEYLPVEVSLPAVGQGAIAVEVRAGDSAIIELVQAINHQETWDAVLAERAFLRALGGGCQAPIAAFAQHDGGLLTVDGMIALPDGSRIVRAQVTGRATDPEGLGRGLAEHLLANGGAAIIAEVGTRDQP